MNNKDEIQIIVNKFIEIIYEQYLKDLKTGNINNLYKPVKPYEKMKNKKGFMNGYQNQTLFNYSQ